MLILVTYDVSTETAEGRRRLRRVAKVCQDYGQRVQKSVFECRVDATDYERLEAALLDEIDEKEDNLRIYRLHEPLSKNVKEFGCFKATDYSLNVGDIVLQRPTPSTIFAIIREETRASTPKNILSSWTCLRAVLPPE